MDRKSQILMAIIEAHINKGVPVGSSFLNEISEFNVSSATIRKEMNKLENSGLVKQTHTSSGRVPTALGYKEYVNKYINISEQYRKEIKEKFGKKKDEYFLTKARERVYDATAILSSISENIAFATIPENTKTIYLGFANILRQPEFEDDLKKISSIIEIFEGGLISRLNEIDISNNEVKVFIGDENIFEQFSSCSLLAIRYCSYNYEGVIGILGPMRMNYAKNIVLLEEAKALIEGENYVKKLN